MLQKDKVLISSRAQMISQEFEKKQRAVERDRKTDAKIGVLMFDSKLQTWRIRRISQVYKQSRIKHECRIFT